MKKLHVFWDFALSYLLILLIPLSMIALVYYRIPRIVEDIEIGGVSSSLATAAASLDDQFTELEKLANLLAKDPLIRRLAGRTEPFEGDDYYLIWDTIRRLEGFPQQNQFIHSFYVYLPSSERILTTGALYSSVFFYSDILSCYGRSYADWREDMLRSDHGGAYAPADIVLAASGAVGLSALYYAKSFPGESDADYNRVIWMLIDKKRIVQGLGSYPSGGHAFILDSDNRVLISSTDSPNTYVDAQMPFQSGHFRDDSRRALIAYRSSSHNDWKYVAAIPYSSVIARTRSIRQLLIGIGFAFTLLGFLAVYLLSLRSTKPLMEIVSLLRFGGKSKAPKSPNEYEYIKTNLRGLIRTNLSLEQQMLEQLPMVQAVFFQRLFRGEFADDSEILHHISPLNLKISGAGFCAALISFHADDENDLGKLTKNLLAAKAVVKNITAREYSSRLFLLDRAENEIAVLVRFSKDEMNQYQKIANFIFERIARELYRDHHFMISVSGGRLYHFLRDVWRSFRESLDSMNYISINSEFRIQWYEELHEASSGYFYPVELEERLINNVKAASREEVVRILNTIYQENVEKRPLPSEMIRMLTRNLHCTAVKILSQIGAHGADEATELFTMIETLHHPTSFTDAFETMKHVFLRMCSFVDVRKASHNLALIDEIKEYIKVNFGDVNLNRYQVASRFSLTETYFSVLFREQTGVYFSHYLENYRIQAACDMLLQESISIGGVAERVGYASDATFSRAFKRVKGLSPSRFKDAMLKGAADNLAGVEHSGDAD